jgi:hypothetical protein
MSAGDDIAAEIRAAYIEVGNATGNGPLYCTIRRATPRTDPDDPVTPPQYIEVVAYQGKRHIRDAAGTLIGVTMTTLKIGGGIVEPLKSDYVAIGTRADDVTSQTRFEQVSDVETLAPAGVALMYTILIAD